MSDAATAVSLSITDGIGRLTLINGAKGNPLGAAFGRELREAAIRLDESPDVRVVLLTAGGKNFCVGGDLGTFAGTADLASTVKSMTADYHTALSKLLRMRAPIVTAVQGACAGAGVALAALGDIVIAGTGSTYTVAYTAIGFSPDGASTFILPRLIGLRRFQELALTNRRIEAAEAVRIGLVTEAVDDGVLAGRAEDMAKTLAAGATGAFGATRRLLLETYGSTLETQLEWEARLLSDLCRGSDVREGIAAALQRRPANFTGA